MRFCTNCGAKLGENDRFCVQCGQERDDWPVQGATPSNDAASGPAQSDQSADLASQPTMVDPSMQQPVSPQVPQAAQSAVPAPTVPLPYTAQPATGATAIPVPGTPVGTTQAPTAPQSQSQPKSRQNKGLIAAIIVAAVVAVALVGALLWVLVIHPRMSGSPSQASSSQSTGTSGKSGSGTSGESADTKAKACADAPDFNIDSHDMHGKDLVVRLKVTASCGSGSTLNLDDDAVRITLKDGDATLADAVYGFSDDPLTAKAGEDAETSVAFAQSQYWFVPGEADWDNLEITGELGADAQGDKAKLDNSKDFAGADALDKDGREKVAKAAIDRQISHDKSAVDDLTGDYTTQLSSKQLNMQADGKTWTYQDIWQQYVDLKNDWPNTVLLWSGDWPKYQRSGTTEYYVMLSGETFGSIDDGWDWCSANGFGQNDCMPISFE
ncbi:zinc ribbon domain-containing protein [Bifidobacterium miconisargentati]|uniref:zinc ribbon domain-containing protein n=1 Tax=Bifidobacterium miconisargentati TaxID=2834437 RepID=UPI001BDC6DCA|nr:zinc ribbon domain-containing protein [Bifidobacterium miconisargentati]MBW3089784.1 zinc-ribbon domain-containing protein [Bifidobacterium miconisargentati]